jgi:hypothetical protein
MIEGATVLASRAGFSMGRLEGVEALVEALAEGVEALAQAASCCSYRAAAASKCLAASS